MLTKKGYIRLVLAAFVLVWSMPSQAQAAFFVDTADAAVVVKDAEAADMMVTPNASAPVIGEATAAVSGTGLTGVGKSFWQYVRDSMKSVTDSQEAVEMDKNQKLSVEDLGVTKTAVAPAAAPVVIDQLVKMDVAPTVPADLDIPVPPVEEPAAVSDDDALLFPLLYEGKAASAAAGIGETGYLGTAIGKAAAGLVLLAVALGVVLPLTLGSGSGSSGGSTGGSGGSDPNSLSEGFLPIGGGGDGVGGEGSGQQGGNPNPGDGSSQPVPEPFGLALFGMGLVGLFLKRNGESV